MMSDTLTLTSAVIVIVATLGAMFFHGPVMPNHEARKTFNPAMIFYPVMVGIWLVVAALREWGDKWESPDGPPVEMVHKTYGHVTHIVPTCADCGEALSPFDIKLKRGPGARANTPVVA